VNVVGFVNGAPVLEMNRPLIQILLTFPGSAIEALHFPTERRDSSHIKNGRKLPVDNAATGGTARVNATLFVVGAASVNVPGSSVAAFRERLARFKERESFVCVRRFV
jgi:hypothetical protein